MDERISIKAIRRFVSTLLPTSFFLYVSKALHLQPILKGLSGDADHVADADRLEQSGVCEFIGRSAADTENGCDVIHGVLFDFLPIGMAEI